MATFPPSYSARATTNTNAGTGSGSSLDPVILLCAGVATLVATAVTATSIWLHLKNYRKPVLQRCALVFMWGTHG